MNTGKTPGKEGIKSELLQMGGENCGRTDAPYLAADLAERADSSKLDGCNTCVPLQGFG